MNNNFYSIVLHHLKLKIFTQKQKNTVHSLVSYTVISQVSSLSMY